MSFDGYRTPGHYILAKQREARRNEFVIGVVICFVIIIGMIIVFNYISEKQVDGLTKQEAEMEYCKLVKPLKYPDASSTVIDRLCYLEQIGKELAR